jgi:hypothetical protein
MLTKNSKPKINLEKVGQIKNFLKTALSISDNSTISVTQLACLEKGCPPIETVVALLQPGSNPLLHKLHKSVDEIQASDLIEISIRWGIPVEIDAFDKFNKEI